MELTSGSIIVFFESLPKNQAKVLCDETVSEVLVTLYIIR